jgi:hypothetical protein
MRTLIASVFCCLMLSACSSSIDTLIPESSLDGALPNLNIQFSEQTGKSVEGHRLLAAAVTVPFDIRRDQVKPTLLSIIKQIKHAEPSCEWIVAYLVPGDSTLPLLQAGIATYKEGKIEIRYGVPSDKNLADYNALKSNVGADNNPPLVRPDKAAFEIGGNVLRSCLSNEERLILAGNMQEADSDYALSILPYVSKETGVSLRETKRLYHQLMVYYMPNWGKETISSEK